MKTVLLGGAALCLVALAGCAAVTERTGLTAAEQACIAQTAMAVQSDPAAKDLRPQQKAALIAASCQIDLDELLVREG